MTASSGQQTSLPVAWPLAVSLSLTTVVVAFVCTPPPSALHSWAQVFTRATIYVAIACCVHALAVWAVCSVRKEDAHAGLPLILPVIWTVWVAVVWLPLISLLTAEHSPWVAAILPVTAIFAMLLLRLRKTVPEANDDPFVSYDAPEGPFQLLESPPLWRTLLPAVVTVIAAQSGAAILIAGHSWIAGCIFGAGALHPVERLLDRSTVVINDRRERTLQHTAAGNSLIVWLLILLALVPFIAGFTSGELSGLLGIKARTVRIPAPPSIAHSKSSGYSGIILVQPKKPHEIVAPEPLTTTAGSLKDTRVIPFDGAYWYFKQPDTQPGPTARVTQGDPVKKRIFSTDQESLIMEAHQPLGKDLAMNCCRSLKLDVRNGDNVPGIIAVEVLLGNAISAKRVRAVSLGIIVLPTSTVSPMPLQRPPVDDTVTFKAPRTAHGATFNEITVRIIPEHSRSLAGAQVAIKDFVLQP